MLFKDYSIGDEQSKEQMANAAQVASNAQLHCEELGVRRSAFFSL
jgi:hypothetical protein